MDRFRLIEEVQRRPALWNFQRLERSRLRNTDLWREVASCVGPDVTIEACKAKWKHLRDAYRTEVKRAQRRIERDIRNGKYNPTQNYHGKWAYFEAMKFIQTRTKDYQPYS